MAVVQHQIQSVILVPVVVAEVLQKGLLVIGIVQVFSNLNYVTIGIPKHLPQVCRCRVVDTSCGVGGVCGVVAVQQTFGAVVVALLLAAHTACGCKVHFQIVTGVCRGKIASGGCQPIEVIVLVVKSISATYAVHGCGTVGNPRYIILVVKGVGDFLQSRAAGLRILTSRSR